MTTDTKEKLARIIVTNPFCGICFMQVCAEKDATDEEILKTCNSENPAGTSHGWAKVWREDEKTEDGEVRKLGPVCCSDDPDRLHLMVNC